MATKDSALRLKLIGQDAQGIDATTVGRRQSGANLLVADNVVPERGAIIARRGYARIEGDTAHGLTEPRGLHTCMISGTPVAFGAWAHQDGTVRVYKFSYASALWSEVTGPTDALRFSSSIPYPIRFAQVKSGAEDIVLMSNGVEDVLAYYVAEDVTRRQYYVERPDDDKLRIWYKPYSFGNNQLNGWFALPASASYPLYSADNATKFKLRDVLQPSGVGIGNGDTIQLQANAATDGLRATVQFTPDDATALDMNNGYQIIFHVDEPSILLFSTKIEIFDSTGGWKTIYHPTDPTQYDRIDVNGNWIALSVRNIQDTHKDRVHRMRFTWLSSTYTTFLLTFAGFRLGGKISATSAYSSTYYDSANRQESAPGTPRVFTPQGGLAGWLPGIYVGAYQLPLDPNFFYVFQIVHYGSSQASVDKARIYRQSPDGVWMHVGDVNANGGSMDDNTPDLEITSTAQRPLPGMIPVPPCKFMAPVANRLCCANVVLPVPPSEETILASTVITASGVSATAQPKRPARLRLVAHGPSVERISISGLDPNDNPVTDFVYLNNLEPVETKFVFAKILPNGFKKVSNGSDPTVTVTSGSYAQYSDRWYISRGDDPLRFARVPSIDDSFSGTWAATGGYSINAMEVLQAGTGDRIVVFTADGNAYIYEGMDISSLATARERIPVPGVAPYASTSLIDGIAYVDSDRRFRILGSSMDIGYPVWAYLESAVDSRSIFASFDGRDLLLTYRTSGQLNDKAIILDSMRGVWKHDSTRFVRHTVSSTRTDALPNLYFQDTAGRYVVAIGTDSDVDFTTIPNEWYGVEVSLDTGPVDLAGPNRSATVFGIWAELQGMLRRIGPLINPFSGGGIGTHYIVIPYDITSQIVVGVTKVSINPPNWDVWKTVTSCVYSSGVTTVTFANDDPIGPSDDPKNPRFSIDVTFTITGLPSEEVYTVTKAFVGPKRHMWRHAVRKDTRFRASALHLAIRTVTHAGWKLYAAGIEMEPQELDPYE